MIDHHRTQYNDRTMNRTLGRITTDIPCACAMRTDVSIRISSARTRIFSADEHTLQSIHIFTFTHSEDNLISKETHK